MYGTFDTLSERLDDLDTHVIAGENGGAFGPWVRLVPTYQEAVDGNLFPCFVDASSLVPTLPSGLRYRMIGSGRAEMEGLLAYLTGPTVPDDFAIPPTPTNIVTLPAEALPLDTPCSGSTGCYDLDTGMVEFAVTAIGGSTNPVPGVVRTIGWTKPIGVVGTSAWDVA